MKYIKKLQNIYASALSKNENVKSDSAKRKDRINNIENEIERWKKLNSGSEIMLKELKTRKDKIYEKTQEIEKKPQSLAIQKGQLIENIKSTEKEKIEIEEKIKKVEEVLKEIAGKDKIEIKKFVRYKVGEGI